MYGFINKQNLLINTAVSYEGNTEILERIKKEFNADNYYPINIEQDFIMLNESYWDGERFYIPENAI